MVKCGDRRYARPYRIPRRGSEDRFIADLDSAADSCPAFKLETSLYKTDAAVQQLAEDIARDLAFA
jgi:hypothetical protein